MYKKLFKPKTKDEEIEDMIRMIKSTGKLLEIGGFGRDWYSEKFLYKGNLKEDKFTKKIKDYELYIDKNNHTQKIRGPWHKRMPAGHGLKITETSARITYSAIPIQDTDFAWCRIENNRLENGYMTEYGIKMTNCLQAIDNPNAVKIPTDKALHKSVHRPGLEKLLARAERLNNQKLIDIYKEKIELSKNDTYQRVYNYFILRIKKNGEPLQHPKLPHKFSNMHDFDSNWHADPLYERDTVHQILDSKLKDHIVGMMEKYIDDTKSVFNRGNINIEDIHHLHATNDAEYSNMMRTLALARAEEDEKGQFRLSKNSYSQSVGIDIPKEYFERDGPYKYKHPKKPPGLLENDKLKQKRKQYVQEMKIPKLKDNDASNQESVIKEHAGWSIKKQHWPVTSKRNYEKSLYKIKTSVLITTYHLRAMLIDMKDEIFKENYTYMGDIKCEPSQFYYLKKWYEYVIESIVPEMIDLVKETVTKDPSAPKPIKYHFSDRHLFEPSGPRRRRGRVPTPPRTIPNQETNDDGNTNENEEQDMNNYNLVMNNVQLDENIHVNVSYNTTVLNNLLENYGQYRRELDSYIYQTLGHSRNHYDRIIRERPLTEREIYDIQIMPHGNHQRNQWGIIKELCRRWDEGTVEQDINDPRTVEFRAVIGEHWPNNIPNSVAPERGVSIWSTHNYTVKEKDQGLFKTQQFAYEICSQMLPAILAVLHKTYCWTIVNPVATVNTPVNDIHILFPGCEWFKRITLSLVNVNTRISYTLSPMVSNWLIPPELKDTNENFMSNQNTFKSIGLTSDGYLTPDASEYITNGLQQQIRNQAIDWAMRKSTPEQQQKLFQAQQAFNTSGPKNMTDVILNFQRQSYISSYLSYLGETRQGYIDAAQLSGTDSGKMVQNSLSAQIMAGQTIAYQTMLQMYIDINWILAAWGMASFIALFAGNIKTVKGVKMSSICQLGVPFGMAASKMAWDATYTPEFNKYPQYITKIGIGLYLGSFLITSNVLTKLIDDSVEDENEFNVQRYLSNRQQWWKWVYWRNKLAKISRTGSLSAFKSIKNEFIQQSRRFSGFKEGSHPDVGKILCPNKPRDSRNDGKTNVIYFNIDDANSYFHHREIESRTRARNIHYPPGMFFNYWGKPHVVVDDLETMYQYINDDTNPKKVLNALFEQTAVKSIASNTQASTYPSLTIGSILEKVGNVSVEGKSFDDTMNILQNSSRPLGLTFRLNENGNTLICTFRDSNIGIQFEKIGAYKFEIDEEEKTWGEWFKIKEIEWSSSKFSILNIKKQFRIAYNIEDQKVVLLSVAGKNYAQSIKNTIVLSTCCAMGVMGMGYTPDDNAVRAAMATIGVFLSAENNIALVPTAVGAATYSLSLRPKEYVSIENSIPLEFFSILAGYVASQAVNLGNWFIYTPNSISSISREDILVGYKFGLLIPLHLDQPKTLNPETTYERKVWGGKLWCPITGRIFWFKNTVKEQVVQEQPREAYQYLDKWRNINGENVKLFYDIRHDDSHLQNIEDGFDIEMQGDNLVLNFYEHTENPGSIVTQIKKHASYIYKPSPMNTHLWFIKVN